MSDSNKISKIKSKFASKTSSTKNQAQNLLQVLGLTVEDKLELENKLRLAIAFDSFSEQIFNFIYKDQMLEKQVKLLTERLESLGSIREEDKLLKQQYETKQIKEIIYNLKAKAEKVASNKGYDKPFDKRYRIYNYLLTIPVLAIFAIMAFVDTLFGFNITLFLFPLLCVVLMGPRMIRRSLLTKWFNFKEENKNQFYSENREDIVILKEYIYEILENIRQFLIEKRIPFQIIKFQLFSRDYDNIEVLSNYPLRNYPGEKQYFVSFKYPPGITPFPIPKELKQFDEKLESKEQEKNFIILTELKAKNGIIESFVPSLKDELAEEINTMLNNCEFLKVPDDIIAIIPSYSEESGIYCPCGEIVRISNIQICDWKNIFKFYLFEGEKCKCGEKVYALSSMDENIEIPEDLKVIFTN